MRLPRIVAAFSLALLAVSTGCVQMRSRGDSSGRVLRGHVAVDDPHAVPPGAVVQLTLTDLSRPDGSDAVIARYGIRPEGKPPFPFALRTDSVAFESGHRYGIVASILDRTGRPFFANDQPHPVFPGETAEIEVSVHLLETALPQREWWEGGDSP